MTKLRIHKQKCNRMLAALCVCLLTLSPCTEALYAFGYPGGGTDVTVSSTVSDAEREHDQENREENKATASEGTHVTDSSAETAEQESDATSSVPKRYPAFSHEEEFDGVTVKLSAKRGVLPEGTTAEIYELDRYELNTDEDIDLAFDIKLYDEDGNDLGDSWKDRGEVTVKFTGSRIDELKENAETVEILHIADDAEELVKSVDTSANAGRRTGLSFDAEHFSVYALKAVAAAAENAEYDADTKTLTIHSVEGMTFSMNGKNPWPDGSDQAVKVVINVGDEELPKYTLNSQRKAKTIIIERCGNINENFFNLLSPETIEIERCGDILGKMAASGNRTVTSIIINECGSIGNGAFSGFRGLETLKINDCGDIGNSAFSNCNALENAEISQCGNIGSSVFSSTALKDLTLNCGDIKSGAFKSTPSIEKLIIQKAGNIENRAFLGMTGLKTIEINECGSIGNEAFSAYIYDTNTSKPCENLETVKIGSCESIGDSAFKELTKINVLEIESCKKIGKMAFNNTGNENRPITKLELKNCVIGDSAFYMSHISEIMLQDIPEIGDDAFYCVEASDVTLSNVAQIGKNAFAGSRKLNKLSIENIKSIEDNMFKTYDSDKNYVTTITLKNIGYIGNYAFENFPLLENVIIEGDCQYIGAHAFTGSKNLKTIDISDTTRLGYSDSFVKVTDSKDPSVHPIYNRVKAILSGKFGLINPETEVDAISPDGWTSYRTGIKNSTDKTGSTQLTKEARWSDAEKTVADVQIKAYYTLNRQMDFIFVADCSNSMSGIGSNDAMNSNFYNMQSKMMDVTEKLLSDTSELDTRVAFATFGEEESSVSDFFVKGDEAKAETYIWNDIVNYYSNTNYSVGLEKASELVKQNRAAGRNTTVIFISDGQPYYDGKVENIPPEYYGTEQAEAIRADGAKLFAVLQQVPEDELESSQANMLKLTADEGNIFSSTDLDGFSHAINDAIEYAYTNFQLTDVVDPAFELDETSINVTGGTVTLGTNAAGLTTITWTFHQSTEPFKEYILTFQEKLNPNSDGSYPDGSFDTNEGDAVFEADKVPVNQVKTPVLERENEKKTGDLIVKKTVSGNNANRNYAFTFRIEAEEAGTPLSGSFGDVTFTDGEGSFTLKAGEQAAVTGLPEGTSYKVQETDGVRMGYTVTVNGTKTDTAEGSVVSGETAIETFNNHRTSGGSSGGGGGGGVVPGKPYHPETKDPLIPEGETAESSSSPHPEINSLPIMGVAGPAEEIQDASDSGAQPLENKSLSVIEALQAKYTQNPDLGGWLTVPGTGSGYPVMYSAYSWEYYLHHDFNKQSSNVGVPFMGEATEIGGDNTLIHGHNMNGDLQFGWIWNYLYPEFREKHPTIDFKTIYDADGQYEVMAVFIAPVYAAEDTNVFKWYQYVGKLNKAQFNYYVENAKANSLYDTGVTAEYGDKLITLETCASSTTNDRLVVVARKKAL